MVDMNKAIASAIATGKVVFGANEAIKSAKTGKAQLFIIAANSPIQIRQDIEYYGKLSQIQVVAYDGNNFDLGRACGKRFPVGALTIKNPGDSDILKFAEKPGKDLETGASSVEEFSN